MELLDQMPSPPQRWEGDKVGDEETFLRRQTVELSVGKT